MNESFHIFKKFSYLQWIISSVTGLLGSNASGSASLSPDRKMSTPTKFGLKLNIQKTKIMASGPITSWQIDGETVETVSDFIFGGSKITADGDCSYEI